MPEYRGYDKPTRSSIVAQGRDGTIHCTSAYTPDGEGICHMARLWADEAPNGDTCFGFQEFHAESGWSRTVYRNGFNSVMKFWRAAVDKFPVYGADKLTQEGDNA